MQTGKNREQSLLLVLIDVISLLISFFVSVIVWPWLFQLFTEEETWIRQVPYALTTFLIAFLLSSIIFGSDKEFLRRNKLDEFFHSVEMNFMTLLVMVLIIFLLKGGDLVSRGSVGVTIAVNVFINCIFRTWVKKWYIKRLSTKKVSQMMVITTSDRVESLLAKLKKDLDWGRRICGVCILDAERQGERVQDVAVVANYYDVIEYVKNVVVDEVFLNVSYTDGKHVKEFISKLEEMGITVYLNIDIIEGEEGMGSQVTTIQGIPVISYAVQTFSWNQMMIKRVIDICGAIVGLLITLVITPFVAVPLLIESPGPLLFKQKRVGRNGRYFYIYKFRSMYRDAEARKAELMAKNEMKGAMFKMTDDPRITKVGKFIRATSIDELPQFWNVLKGDMSLVGTRPPTVDEFMEYTPYHKRRLSLKPGMTGMWQVSGRSDIEDFEEVVKLDLYYIDHWRVSLDLKILIKTVMVVFKKEGSK